MPREMKETGIEWIGEVPKDWDIVKVKYLFNIISGSGFPIDMQGNSIGDYPVCKAADIARANSYANGLLTSSSNYLNKDEITGFNVISKNSILMAKIGEAMKKNNRAIAGVDLLIDNNCQALEPYAINYKFAYYLLKIVDMAWFDNSGTIPSINNIKFKNSVMPYPKPEEQKKIADLLDKKCQEVEEIKETIESEIKTLDEYKKSIITEAVTKGLDKGAEMKDSGIEWIGQIPNHWKVVKLKYTSDSELSNSFIDGDWIDSKYIDESGIRYLTTGNIGDGIFKEQGNGYISKETFFLLNCKYAYPNDLIISRLNAPYGRSCLLPDTFEKYVVAVDNVILRPSRNYSKKYINYVTQCNGYQNSVEDSASGTTMKRISRVKLGNINIISPPINEQKAIAEYLDHKTSAINEAIDGKRAQLVALDEYKKSIIYEYVTGKKEA